MKKKPRIQLRLTSTEYYKNVAKEHVSKPLR